jgi:hypothetical protein
MTLVLINYIIMEQQIFKCIISNKPCQCRCSDYWGWGDNMLCIVYVRFVIYFNVYFNVMIKWINSCALIFYSTYSKRLHTPFPQNDQSNNWKLASYINISRYIYTQYKHIYQFRTTYNGHSSISPAFTSSNIIPGCDNTFTHKSNGSVNQLFHL